MTDSSPIPLNNLCIDFFQLTNLMHTSFIL